MVKYFLSLHGDEASSEKFEQLYIIYKDQMFSLAYSILQNSHDAEDAVQIAYISVGRNIHRIGDPDSLSSKCYVIKAVRHISYNMKKDKWGQVQFADDIESIPDPTKIDLTEQWVNKESFTHLLNFILSLDKKYRDVIYLHFVEGLTANEIAAMLDQKLPTIKQRLVRGKRLLIQKLKDTYIQEEKAEISCPQKY